MDLIVGFLGVVVVSGIMGTLLGRLMMRAAKQSRIKRDQMAFVSAKHCGH